MAKTELCSTRDLPKSLLEIMNANEPSVLKIVLRILKFLCYDNIPFQTTLLSMKCVKVILRCMESSDEDVQYWSTFLMLDLASQG